MIPQPWTYYAGMVWRILLLTAVLGGLVAGFTWGIVNAIRADAFPSDECYATYSTEFCDRFADKLDDLPLWEDLSTDTVGGYRTGDVVPTGHGDAVPVPVEALDAVNRTAATPDEERLMVDLSACESRFVRTADGPGTASGPWQFLAGTWSRVAAATGFGDIWSWADQAHNTLWLGRTDGWWHWSCTEIQR